MLMDNYYDDTQGCYILSNAWANAERPNIAVFYHEELQRPGSDAAAAALDVAKTDFVIQWATYAGFRQGDQEPRQPRHSQVEMAKYWMLGFLEWYCVAPPHSRNDTNNHRSIAENCHAGKLIMARRRYRDIDWSLDYIKRHDGLWNAAGISAEDLTRIDSFWGRAKVQTWQVINGVFGQVRMPKEVTYSGRTITLGWEIVSDWILPPDANHGVGMLTISHMLGEILKYQSLGASRQTSVRRRTDGYEFSSGNKTHIMALGQGTGVIVSCYRV